MPAERLQKIIAAAGIASRRKAEQLITGGLVSVNGKVVTELGSKADAEQDHIRVNGKLLHGAERHVYLVMNKPKGYVTTLSDPERRPTVMDLLRGVGARVYPVGRLDHACEGLRLLTNDGEFANRLMKAASHVPNTYMVKLAGTPSVEGLSRLRSGLFMAVPGGSRMKTARVTIVLVGPPGSAWADARWSSPGIDGGAVAAYTVDRFRNSSKMAGENASQALDTPPPTTYSGRLRAFTKSAITIPSACPTRRKIFLASSSPWMARLYTALALNSGFTPAACESPGAICCSIASRAMRTTAVAEAYCSKHPRFPHPHCTPSGSTVICPNSPAIPVMPCHITRPKTIPPPTPVPSVNMAISSTLRAAPNQFSPNAAALASFSRITRVPSICSICARTGDSAHPGKLGDSRNVPVFISIIPGTPMPIPCSVPDPSYLCARWRIASHMSWITRSLPNATCVPNVTFSSRTPCSSTAAMRRLVPPRSTPIEKSDIGKTDFQFPIANCRFEIQIRINVKVAPASRLAMSSNRQLEIGNRKCHSWHFGQ